MSIQNFFTSRDNNLDGNTYVGQLDRLWYNPDTNSLYVSDGVTPGGLPVDLALGANATFNIITANSGTISGNLTIGGNISPAAVGKIGGITPGPGANVSNTGLLTIDTTGLPLSFGNFTANNNILTIVNSDEDMILATSGDAEIELVGNIGFYRTNGLPPDTGNRYFRATDDGRITITVTETDTVGAVRIVGSASGNTIDPAVAGVMLHITGQTGNFATQYIDGINSFSNYIGRRYNGNADAPTQIVTNDTIVRFSGQGYTSSGFSALGATGSIGLTALEDFTATAQGSAWRFYNIPIGGNTRQEVANITVANGVTATKFETTGNVTAGNLTLSTGGIVSSTGLITTTANVSAGNISVTGAAAITGNVTAGNVNSYVVLPAGTTSKAPLVFTSGSILTTAAPGAVNYDGRIFYATPQGQERGLVKAAQTFVLNADYTLTDQAAVQSMFGVTAAVSSTTRYAYVVTAVVYKTANNITMSYAIDGTATLARHTYQTLTTASAALATLSTPSVVKNILTTGFSTGVTVTDSLNGTGFYSIQAVGVINVTTGGTWNPLVAFSGLPGAGSYVAAGSSIEIYPIGATGANVSIGNWT